MQKKKKNSTYSPLFGMRKSLWGVARMDLMSHWKSSSTIATSSSSITVTEIQKLYFRMIIYPMINSNARFILQPCLRVAYKWRNLMLSISSIYFHKGCIWYKWEQILSILFYIFMLFDWFFFPIYIFTTLINKFNNKK